MSCEDSSDDSSTVDREFELVPVGQSMCHYMSDSGSDDDVNNEQDETNIKHQNYSSDPEDDQDFKRESSDNDTDLSKNVLTNNSVNEVESYSPSKDLIQRSAESRNSYQDYSPQLKRRRDDSYSMTRNSDVREVHFSHSDSGNHSRDQDLPFVKFNKSEKKSKSHGSLKRRYDECSSSSSSKGFFSPERHDSISDYSIPSGTSLNKPIEGGKGASIMNKMGYQSGQGLGKWGEGRLNPVELSKQKGRQGLGLSIPNLDIACENWDPYLEVIEVKEKVDWLNGPDTMPPSYDELENWMGEGIRDLDVSKMSDFCDPDLLSKVLSCKSVFDNMETLDMIKARSRSNPFETIRKGIFQNRAAMKMANIDSLFDWMFTKPTDCLGNQTVDSNQLLYFADVCAGPGGFSEYILWRKKWRAKGIGFTLKGDNDFKLEDFKSGPPETFEPFYGEKGDGNVFDSDNIRSLTDLVMQVTHKKGVHFMMADGGFSVEGQENIQELLSKQLYLCQFLVALSIVRTEGHFVCKLFDLFSPFSVGLIYLMYRCFHQICIFKPNTSRPANSERYIVCKWKRSNTGYVRDYMFRLNERLSELNSDSYDINYCVPMDVIHDDMNFLDYIISSNNKLGERQVVNLAKISAYYKNDSLIETRQFNLRKDCLEIWKVPDTMPRTDSPRNPDDFLKNYFKKSEESELFSCASVLLTPDIYKESFSNQGFNLMCSVLGDENKELGFFLGLGRNRVMRSRLSKGQWDLVNNCTFELSPGTLVFGEIVPEFSDVRRSSAKNALHILDTFSLGSQNISTFDFSQRMEISELYTEALRKYATPNISPVRFINPIYIAEVNSILKSLSSRQLRGQMQFVIQRNDIVFPVKGLIFFSTTKAPWAKYKSNTSGKFYYFAKGEASQYECNRPKDSISTFRDSVMTSKLWWWEKGVGLLKEDKEPGVLHKDDLLDFIHQNVPR